MNPKIDFSFNNIAITVINFTALLYNYIIIIYLCQGFANLVRLYMISCSD